MEKTYQPSAIESALYPIWENAGYFRPSGQGVPYCIMLPPPNVTGTLHMGHGFEHTLMDILIRYHRMMGDNTLWQCGSDHAGIATQMVVERLLEAEGTSRQKLGRPEFEKRTWAWKEESGGTICRQMRRMGTSPDWSRERFTMDEGLSQSVMEAFIRLHEEGLVYRGERLVNWDCKLQTALSDLEVLSQEENGKLWIIQYTEDLKVATTRPETLLGDTAIAVHPEDPRYLHLIGTKVRVPIVGREIPVVADTHVDPKFGTGCVKITPAHDFNDYEIAKRHQLPLINILTPEGKLNENVPEAYQGLDRFEAREKILKELSIVEIKPHALKVPISDRSGVIVEPRLTTQWYVKMEDMAKAAIRAVKDKDIIFYPENAENTYFEWLNNIQDWCISRQLWWGHRIPAWYDNKGNVYVGRTEAEIRKAHQINASVKLTQDEDVLDTWFSSALWPFSTLGWPDTSTPEFKTFYPTSVLVTGFDLIFFWVARMIMFGLKFTGDVPFKHVYFHGIIRDHEGKKMSKSKGNVLDPVDLIDGITLEKLLTKRTHGMMQPRLKDEIIKATQTQFPEGIPAYGCDALRFTFCALASTSRDVNFDMKRMEGYRNFCNKLWNAARFVLMNVEDFDLNAPRSLSVVEDWIWQRFHTVTAECHQALHEYRFDHMAQLLYEFVWNEFCDWYLELSKVTLSTQTPAAKAGTQYSLLALLEGILRLLHPVIPFITETIWKPVAQKLDLREESLMLRSYPISAGIGDLDEPGISFLKEVITQVRTMKSEMNIAPSKPISLLFKSIKKPQKDYLDQFKPWISALLKAETIDIVKEAPAQCANVLIGQIECFVPLKGLIDLDAEKNRLLKQKEKLEAELSRLEGKLKNANFVKNAPKEVVEKEESKCREYESQLKKIEHALAEF